MRYVIRTGEGRSGFKDISEEYFNQLNESHCCLFNAYQFEQKYDLVVGNFLELENDVFRAVMDHMIGRFPGWTNHFEVQLTINRRVANLLSACKTYFDQMNRHFILCFKGSKKEARSMKQYSGSLYDKRPEYRLMEALRNHVQHHSLAVHSCSVGGKNVDHDGQSRVQYGVEFRVNRSELLHNRKFKALVRDEMPERVDIIAAIRVYMDCINYIQKRGRNLLNLRISEAFKVLQGVAGNEDTSHHMMAPVALVLNEAGEMDAMVPLNLVLHEELQKLRQKNPADLKFDRGFFTSSSLS